MDNKQKINCTVQSCKYNNGREQLCKLNAIMVTPKQNVDTGNPDESECSSYECQYSNSSILLKSSILVYINY